jgi:hypothetical protein
MSASGSVHWPESAMDGSEYKNIWNVFERRSLPARLGERHGWQRIKKPTAWVGKEAATPFS